ncbi:phospholipase B1, membrane-associated-like [Octodon degus]|uniref:Phospholipase B1, membrane-associated-like n=1 Tax=Octodon degus TaxID=10160 RepID=A0A6P6E4E8_OCTDE|nr:phospholipase B1, membrane-associated-like [Octodon degus]
MTANSTRGRTGEELVAVVREAVRGLLVLLGYFTGRPCPVGFPGITQIHTPSGKNALEDQQWPELQTEKNFPFLCNPKKLRLNIPSESVHSLTPADIKLVAAIGNVEIPPASGVVKVDSSERYLSWDSEQEGASDTADQLFT